MAVVAALLQRAPRENQMAHTTATPQKSASLPEVQLQWSDFVWALERLRHKPYGKKMTDR